MAHNSKGMGPNFVPAYQVSGIPYVTSSHGPAVVGTAVQKITFPQVTRFFVVNNIGSNILRVGFTENGVDGGPDESGDHRGPSGARVRVERGAARRLLEHDRAF